MLNKCIETHVYTLYTLCLWITSVHRDNHMTTPDSKVYGANMEPNGADRTQVFISDETIQEPLN